MSKKNAKERGHEPIAVSKADFVAWYEAKLLLSDGECEWCKTPFGKRGPVADHDHETGELRALLCNRCNLVESVGLQKLELIIAAMKKWQNRNKIPTEQVLDEEEKKKIRTSRIEKIESSFNRWSKFIRKGRMKTRDDRRNLVVKELELLTRGDRDLLVETWNKLSLLVDQHDCEDDLGRNNAGSV